MKKIVLVAVLAFVGVTGALSQYAVGQHETGISFGVFYSSLDAYGEWIPVSHGLYGWRPLGVMTGWRPYTVGRWVWSEYGWYWYSDEPWAWAAYHYGRWHYDDYYGWIWIPGYDWAPAWVEWRAGGDHIGWAPLGPYALFNIHVGITYDYGWATPGNYWCFTHARYFNNPRIDRYVYHASNNWRFIGRTRGSGTVRYDGKRIVTHGPEREFIERRTGLRLERAEIVNVSDRSQQQVRREGGRERVQVYRPDTGGRVAGRDLTRPERVREPERRIAIDVGKTDAGARMVERRDAIAPRPSDPYRERATERGSGPDRSAVPETRRNRGEDPRPGTRLELPLDVHDPIGSSTRQESSRRLAPDSRVERTSPPVRPAPEFQSPVPESRISRDAERRPGEREGSRRNPEPRADRNAPPERPAPSYRPPPPSPPRPQAREERRAPETRSNERAPRADERRSERVE